MAESTPAQTRERIRGVSGLFGGYSPLRRAWRRYRPGWIWRLTRMGSRIAPFVAQHGLVVRRGPFAGMVYPDCHVGHANTLAAKLMGAYEMELTDVLLGLALMPFTRIVNIGAGEGYYAVGLARAMPDVIVDAFETDSGERKLCATLAQINGVGERITIHGTCDLRALRRTVTGSTFVVCDCEGCERELLRPDAVQGLSDATVLVELHPMIDPRIPDALVARFADTHEVTRLRGQPRNPADWAEVEGLPPDDAEVLLTESGIFEEPQGPAAPLKEWALMTPRGLRHPQP